MSCMMAYGKCVSPGFEHKHCNDESGASAKRVAPRCGCGCRADVHADEMPYHCFGCSCKGYWVPEQSEEK